MSAAFSRLVSTRRWITVATRLAMLAGLLVPIAALYRDRLDLTAVLPYVLAGVALFLSGALISGLGDLLFKIEANSHRIHELSIEVRNSIDRQNQLLETVSQNSQLSDGVKSITHRDLERDALRRAIREDILKEDWEAAYSLIEDMENRFGYRLEAYNYRKEVDAFRARVIEDKLQVSVRHARELLQQRQWDSAQAEADRLQRLAPSDPRVAEVLEELVGQKNAYKDTLLAEWHQAVEGRDLDRGIALLKEIDPYLTRDEAKKLEQSARDVFKAKLLDLGMQFRQAVTDKTWEDALSIGDRIRTEFPNSQMAREVTESMDALRAKAARVGSPEK